MATVTIDGDLHVTGRMSCNQALLPSGVVSNDQVGGTDLIEPVKAKQRVRIEYSQPHGAAVAAQRRAVHVAHAAGTLRACKAGVVVAALGDSTVSVDVLKNGTTVLSAPITIDNGDAAYDKLGGAFASTSYAAGDVFEVSITVSAGTGTLPQGVFVMLLVDENPQ